MRLTDCEFERLLPLFMQNQKDDLALARGLNPTIRNIGEKIRWLSDWGYIDELPEEFLDALAWELDIDWFAPKSDRTIQIKRELVKNADNVHKKLGTKAAVKSVASDIFGNGHVEEWFDFGGDPGTFRVWISTQLSSDNVARFMKTISQVKNTRSHLIAVTCRISTDLDGDDIDPGEIIDDYGETKIYNEFWYMTEIQESESIDSTFKCRIEVNEPEEVSTSTVIRFEMEQGEGVDAKIVRQSDPLYRYNGVITYSGEYTYNSYYEEEDL